MNRRAGLVVLVCLAVLVAADPAAAGGATIVLEQELVATEEPGEVEVVLRFEVPEPVVGLRTTPPEGATVVESTGFEPADEDGDDPDGEHAWDGTTRSPTLTYIAPANRTFREGGFMFVDTGEWAVVERPGPTVAWRWDGAERVALDRTTTAEAGIAGERFAFLGAHEVDTRKAGDETITIVVPAVASPTESTDAVHGALGDAAKHLDVSGENDRVFVVVVPTGDWWGVRGLQFGSSDAWVRDDSRLDDPDNVWVHEYVHTRQDYEANEELRWFAEATAVYYAALLSYERGDVEYGAFRDRLASGERSPHSDDVLADPGTWTRGPDYHKGALVAADLDRRIRLASDGERDLRDVFRAMNEHEGTVTQSEFLRFVEEAGGPEVREVAREHTETTSGPTTWDERTHRETFGLTAPRMEYRLAEDPDAYRVSGPYRDRPLDEFDEEGVVIVTGERLATTATVENAGDAPGEYEATVRAEGQDREEPTIEVEGRLEPGESDEIPVERTFDEPGTYEVGVEDATVEIRVVEPAEPAVTGFEPDAEPATVAPGEPVGLLATVENDASVPARADLELAGDGGVLASETVRLDAGERATVEFAVTLDTPGEHELRLDDRSATVSVERAAVSAQPGFGVPTAIVAIAIVLALFSEAPPRWRARR